MIRILLANWKLYLLEILPKKLNAATVQYLEYFPPTAILKPMLTDLTANQHKLPSSLGLYLIKNEFHII